MNRFTTSAIPDLVLRAYFLQRLPAPLSTLLEHMYFRSTELFERLEHAEWDLIHDYVSHRLRASEQTRFEQYYLITAGRQQKVAAAREITEIAKEFATADAVKIQEQSPVYMAPRRSVAAMVAVLVAAVIVSSAILLRPTRSFTIDIDQTAQQREFAQTNNPTVLARIPSRVSTVVLRIRPNPPIPGEWAIVGSIEREPAFNARVNQSDDGFLQLTIPRKILHSGLLVIRCSPPSSNAAPQEFRREIQLD